MDHLTNWLSFMYRNALTKLPAFLLAVIASLNSVYATSAESETMQLDGFASFVYSKAIDKKEGDAGRISTEGEYRDDNQFGIRLYKSLNDGVALTIQLTANGASDYKLEIDQLFLNFDLNGNTLLSVGKIRPPIFLYSEVLDISHAYPWIQPPDAVYDPSLNPFKSLEGFKLQHVAEIGPYWTSELVFFMGDTRDPFVVTDVGLDSELVVDNGYGVSWLINHKWLSLRALYFTADTSADITSNAEVAELLFGTDPLDKSDGAIELLSLLVSQTAGRQVSFIEHFVWEEDPSTYLGFGAMLDFERYFAIMEATRIDVDTNIAAPRQDSYYLTLGHKLPEDWTVYATYGVDNNTATKKVWEQFNPYIGANGALNGALDGVLTVARSTVKTRVKQLQDFDIKYLNLGTRWDVTHSMSFKFELMLRQYRNYNSDLGRVHERDPAAVRFGLDLVF